MLLLLNLKKGFGSLLGVAESQKRDLKDCLTMVSQ